MQVRAEGGRALRFDDGSPVLAGSALAPLGDGWLVAQRDGTSAAWLLPSGVERVPLMKPSAAGPQALPPDLGAGCAVPLDGRAAALLLGSGGDAGRRGGLVVAQDETSAARTAVVGADLGPLYEAVARELRVPLDGMALEGVARNGPVLRWFHRGDPATGVPSASVDVGLPGLLEALQGRRSPADVPLRGPRAYDLGDEAGEPLLATDAAALPGGRVVLSATTAGRGTAVLLLLDDREVVARAVLPLPAAARPVVQGLGVLALEGSSVVLLAVVGDDPSEPSQEVRLRLDL